MYIIRNFKDLTNSNLVNNEITIFCWVQSIRIHKKVVFLTLHNNYISLQAVIKDNETMILCEKIPKESCIKVIGILKLRTSNNVNIEQELGKLEIIVNKIHLINACELDIHNDNSNYNIKCKYRFLDIRKKSVFQWIKFRSDLFKFVRDFMNKLDFIEIQTPIISKKTIGGSNQYIVLSQNHINKVFGLPQSPQIFKQMLMHGIINYFQIAPCFRDEESRESRLPMEFYQLDLEQAHIENFHEIINLIDKIMYEIIKEFGIIKNIKYKVCTYYEAIRIYGTDKVDLRLEELNLKYNHNNIVIDYKQEIFEYLKTLGYKLENKNNRITIYYNDIELIYTIISQFIEVDYLSYCWITEFPMFEYDKNNQLQFGHNPFSKPINPDENIYHKILSHQGDLIINGIEIGGGSLRNTDYNNLIKMFSFTGVNEKDTRDNFQYFLDALRGGIPNHGGFAIGLERLCAILTKRTQLRDFVAFPVLQSGYDIMTESPVIISKTELKKYFTL